MNFKRKNDFQFSLFFDNQNILNLIINLATLMNLDVIRLIYNFAMSKMNEGVTLESKFIDKRSKRFKKKIFKK